MHKVSFLNPIIENWWILIIKFFKRFSQYILLFLLAFSQLLSNYRFENLVTNL